MEMSPVRAGTGCTERRWSHRPWKCSTFRCTEGRCSVEILVIGGWLMVLEVFSNFGGSMIISALLVKLSKINLRQNPPTKQKRRRKKEEYCCLNFDCEYCENENATALPCDLAGALAFWRSLQSRLINGYHCLRKSFQTTLLRTWKNAELSECGEFLIRLYRGNRPNGFLFFRNHNCP